MKLILIYIVIIILKAIADGLNDKGSKPLGHTTDALWLGIMLVYPVELVWYVKLISFTLLMIALFDFTYNITRGLPHRFVGTTSWWDQAISTVPFGFMLFVRVICLIVGIFLILNND